jgi:hypothetical protein
LAFRPAFGIGVPDAYPSAWACRCLIATPSLARDVGRAKGVGIRIHNISENTIECPVPQRNVDLVGFSAVEGDDQLHFEEDGAIIYRHACAYGCEGIVSKRLGSPYRSGRTDAWLKVKNPAAPALRRETEEDWS